MALYRAYITDAYRRWQAHRRVEGDNRGSWQGSKTCPEAVYEDILQKDKAQACRIIRIKGINNKELRLRWKE
ncbi:hypothetical protein THC_1237 [Caldimicrobium thiodismutans]|uniref:Uncharacterized protein n=1 Tax=Caldimicrobium thiodismutans TaxID=1653476 RepID=A0A0U5AWB5_9BACT|nr:hypothetical protein THC_1237 [Caldimicrobium thiodismutans]